VKAHSEACGEKGPHAEWAATAAICGARATPSKPINDAEIAGDVVGFIAVTKPPRRADTSPGSLTRSLVDLAHVTHFQGQLVASQRYAVRGPVLIDEAARGRGIYTAFNAVTREVHRDRFDIGVLFVAADNPRSLHTTTVKLGAEPLAVFDVGGRRYHFLAYAF
jgi:hypothetical protein